MDERVNLLDMTLPALTEWFAAQGEKPFRARQVFQWMHQRGVADFDAMTDDDFATPGVTDTVPIFQACGAVEKRLDVTLGVEEEAGAAVRGNGPQFLE